METDWKKAVEKLTYLTRDGNLEWVALNKQQFTSVAESRNEEIRPPIYSAKVMGRRVFVYEYRYRSYHEEDEWHWEDEVGIEFASETFTMEYEWPQVPGRHQLLDEIRLKVAKAEDFIAEFLAD